MSERAKTLEEVLLLEPSDELDDYVASRVMMWRERAGRWYEGNAGQIGTEFMTARHRRGFRPTRDGNHLIHVIDSVGCSMSWKIECSSEGIKVGIVGLGIMLDQEDGDGWVWAEAERGENPDFNLYMCRAALKACWIHSGKYLGITPVKKGESERCTQKTT